MIKKLDILIIRSFVGPFVVTFFVSLFVLIMQFFWLYMDEMIGKGVSIWMLVQLLVYMSTTLVPLALPLSILLSSIMTFGNMGENFELVAIKASGISLLRFMQPLLIFVVFVSGLAFLFANNVIPVANLKALSLLYDVRNAKPTLNIKPDQFNSDIPGYAIRVGSKDKDGNTIRDVVIYDHTDMSGNNKIILAKEGQMIASKQKLIFKLTDGWRYEEGNNHGVHDNTQTRMHFAKWDKMFDLTSLQFTRTNENLFKDAYQMMNVKQLKEQIDSLKKYKIKIHNNISGHIAPYISINNGNNDKALIEKKISDNSLRVHSYDSSFLDLVPDSSRAAVLQTTVNNVRNTKSLLDVSALSSKIDGENYLKFEVEFHRKFSLSFACILLFLIGAPLGAIIRKGGLGMPLVIAVVFFMAFHILNITGEKLAKSASVLPWVGMWMASLLLMPLAVWLIISARNDSQIFTKEWYVRIWRVIKNMLPAKKETIA